MSDASYTTVRRDVPVFEDAGIRYRQERVRRLFAAGRKPKGAKSWRIFIWRKKS